MSCSSSPASWPRWKDAPEERKLIEKAKSLLMTHQGMQEEQAWQTLRKMAMDKNQRMVEIAPRATDGEGDLAANTKGVDAQSMGILCLPAVHF